MTRIPLRCFKDAGGNLAAVGTPLRMRAGKGLVVTIRNIRLDSAGLPVPCPATATD
jgi:beta-glucosidase